ncbi:MAG: histidine kinase [Flavobacteriales bacterium]|nr:histidine kinase [Flavobacteriales bacterium]
MTTETATHRGPFWAFQFGGWGLFLIIVLVANFLQPSFHWSNIALAFAVFGFGFASTSLYRAFVKRREWINKPPLKLIIPITLGSLTTAFVWTLGFLGVQLIIHSFGAPGTKPFDPVELFVSFLNNLFLVLLWSLIYFAYHYFTIAQTARVARYKSEAAARDAQLNTLKGQINPHFMFNSLNNIRALMLEDVTRSREMLTKLSDLLRYSMTISEKRVVPLKDELAVVRDFLDLNKIQFEDKLTYSFDVDASLKEYKIPPMVLQILVENSVKHGISSSTSGGKVIVGAGLEGDRLVLKVSNTGNWTSASKRPDSHGIGLPNIRRRLQLIYGETASLHISEEDELVVAKIELPHE